MKRREILTPASAFSQLWHHTSRSLWKLHAHLGGNENENTNNSLVVIMKVLTIWTHWKEFNPLMCFPDGRFLRHKFYKEYPGKRRNRSSLAERAKRNCKDFLGEKRKRESHCLFRELQSEVAVKGNTHILPSSFYAVKWPSGGGMPRCFWCENLSSILSSPPGGIWHGQEPF